MGQVAQKTNFEPFGSLFVLTTVPQMVENTVQNEGARNFENIRIFAKCTFTSVKSFFFVSQCIKQHELLVDPLGVLMDF